MLGAMDLGVTYDREGAGREQAAQISITPLGDAANGSPCHRSSSVWARGPPRRKSLFPIEMLSGLAMLATSAVASAGPTPGIASSRLLVSLDRCQAMMCRSNSRTCALSMRSCRPKAARHSRVTSGNPIVIRVSDDIEQLFDTVSTNRRNDAELGKVGTDRIDHGSLLANEEVTRAVEHQAALLLGRLGLHEPHARPHDGFADRLSIGGIVLLALEIGFT